MCLRVDEILNARSTISTSYDTMIMMSIFFLFIAGAKMHFADYTELRDKQWQIPQIAEDWKKFSY